MIPTAKPYEARYKHTDNNGRPYFTTKPVLAWEDDTGQALVVDEDTGRLRPAGSYSNFAGVAEGDNGIVAAIPGGGWSVAWKQDDGTDLIGPVLGWVVDSDGWAKPLDVDPHGMYAEPLTVRGTSGCRLIPPDSGAA